jgi:protein gp37
MGSATAIAWTDSTFNPVWGCTKVDPGCSNCYADSFDKRMGGSHWGPHPTFRTFGDSHWNEPLKWDKEAAASGVRRRVFSASMTDLFHVDMPKPVLDRLWALIRATPNLDWLLLTKRADRIAQCLPADWGTGYENVWLGVSVCDRAGHWRVDELRKVPAAIRFISVEPLLESVVEGLDLTGIHWAITGAESGAGHRTMDLNWVREVRDACAKSGVAFFHKQEIDPKGRKIETPVLDGRKWTDYPRAATWKSTKPFTLA